MKIAVFGFAAVGMLGLSGCETTGDPHTGGIFWSERKAQDRLAEREEHLDAVHADTAATRHRNSQLEGAAARRERMLNQ